MLARRPFRVAEQLGGDADVILHVGDRLELLRSLPDGSARLVVTSPPYNVGKAYESRLSRGELRLRPMGKPILDPRNAGAVGRRPPEFGAQ